MKRIFYIVPILLLVGLSACKPAHDNVWDPDNPSKAMIRGTVEAVREISKEILGFFQVKTMIRPKASSGKRTVAKQPTRTGSTAIMVTMISP